MKINGFTLIELIVVMGLLATFIGFITINLVGSQGSATLSQTVDMLVADLQSQQTKAMTGSMTNGSLPAGYGIYFESDRYVMFSGAAYDPAGTSNAIVNLQAPVIISLIGFPGHQIVFQTNSGEINAFVSGSDYVRVQNTADNQEKEIQINRLGVVTAVEII